MARLASLPKQKPYFPRSHWQDASNQSSFINQLSKEFGIRIPSDWGKITLQQIRKLGGAYMIEHYFGGSLQKALVKHFPETEWKREWFKNSKSKERNFWKAKENQKLCLDKIATELNLEKPQDWGKVSTDQLKKYGFLPALRNYYSGSLFSALKSTHPEIDWRLDWFHHSPNYWKNMQHLHNFFVNLEQKFGIKDKMDWGKITVQQVYDEGGSSVLSNYGNSLKKALQSVFPEIQWSDSWFENSKVQRNFWHKKENQRRFLEDFASAFYVSSPREWGTIHHQQILQNGGSRLLALHEGSLFQALKHSYPEVKWQISWFKNARKYKNPMEFDFLKNYAKILENDWNKFTKTILNKDPMVYKSQMMVWKHVSKWFPESEVWWNFRHPAMTHVTDFPIELDVWIPEHKIAFEFHGKQHFVETIFTQSLVEQKRRDQERRAKCNELGITLVEVPYWWDHSEGKLLGALLSVNPSFRDVAKLENENFQQGTSLIPYLATPSRIPVSHSGTLY